MFFLMECRHHDTAAEARDSLRPVHREWVRSGGDGLASVLCGSALWANDGTPVGHWGIVEAPTPEAARAFAEGDPFHTGGVVAAISLTRLADTFAADRITPRLTQG